MRLDRTGYPDFFALEDSPLDLVAVVGESPSLLSRKVWRKRLEVIEDEAFMLLQNILASRNGIWYHSRRFLRNIP